MKHIWTPWRKPYVAGQVRHEGCVFCRIVAQDEQHDPANYVLHRGQRVFAVLNLYPYNNGHLMVLPYEHIANLDDLAPPTQADLMHLVCYFVGIIRRGMSPAGFNIGVNLGRAAGAGIDDHVHVHVVPRWLGDTNFMPVIAETRVIPELLDETYRNLRALVEQYPPPC
ncbi:MAG: HIT family hydrolase [Ardenticatenia bacterium]|nr:MAG: HIT family hydrolase [Ardenticatenia bacterium]